MAYSTIIILLEVNYLFSWVAPRRMVQWLWMLPTKKPEHKEKFVLIPRIKPNLQIMETKPHPKPTQPIYFRCLYPEFNQHLPSIITLISTLREQYLNQIQTLHHLLRPQRLLYHLHKTTLIATVLMNSTVMKTMLMTMLIKTFLFKMSGRTTVLSLRNK